MYKPITALCLVGCIGSASLSDVKDSTSESTSTADVPTLPALPVAVVDLGRSSGLNDTAGGIFKRGRACVAADFDGDDRIDLYFGNPGDPSLWLRNITEPGGPVRFEPQQILSPDELFWGATAADYDDDGDIDLFVTAGGNEGNARDRLFANQGDGTLEDVASEAGLGGRWAADGILSTASANAQFIDYDADGRLDLFVNVNAHPYRSLVPGDGSKIAQNFLWWNVGDGSFEDRAEDVGFTHRGRTRHSSWLDADLDGDLDLYENNHDGTNILWLNQLKETGSATFETGNEVLNGPGSDIGYPKNSFASAAADFNQDGREDLFVFARGWPELGPHRDGHALFLNTEQGFIEVSLYAGFNTHFDPMHVAGEGASDCGSEPTSQVAALGVMGATVADLNYDGIPDILAGNGGPPSGMYNQLFLSHGLVSIEHPEVGTLRVPQYLDASELTDFPAEDDPAIEESPDYPYRTHGMCVVDLDDDGQVEVIVTNGGAAFWGIGGREPNRVFRFDYAEERHWLKVRLEGNSRSVPRSPMGSAVTVTARWGESTWTVTERLRSSNGFNAAHGPDLVFGLANAEAIDRVEVRWTDGHITVLEDVTPDQRLHIAR